ncbi:MAG: PAQR family membrane homeostasis protein TrhA, partial [Mycobacterium sp.]
MSHHVDSVSRPDFVIRAAGVDDLAKDADTPSKPRLRGWIHLYCAIAAFFAGSALVVVSWALASQRAGHSTLTYS